MPEYKDMTYNMKWTLRMAHTIMRNRGAPEHRTIMEVAKACEGYGMAKEAATLYRYADAMKAAT